MILRALCPPLFLYDLLLWGKKMVFSFPRLFFPGDLANVLPIVVTTFPVWAFFSSLTHFYSLHSSSNWESTEPAWQRTGEVCQHQLHLDQCVLLITATHEAEHSKDDWTHVWGTRIMLTNSSLCLIFWCNSIGCGRVKVPHSSFYRAVLELWPKQWYFISAPMF